ncbi:MAG: hypothetical protein IKU37_01230 [Candidatus Gastranaerophilales bacterium]|nr:hypothetical protein [Candidatus Gastranaerophilales bacterium]
MANNKQKNYEIRKKNQNDLRELEQFYTEGKIDNMLETIQERKEELVKQMIKYHDNHLKECKWDKEGNPIAWKVDINPLVINNYFFKPITPIGCQEPAYNAEKLSMVFDYYCDILAEVNDKIGNYPSSLTSFCRFSGITYNTLRQYKNSQDYNMRVIAEKIYDQIGDENVTMSQMGFVKERTTLFKMKSQNEMVEKVQPQVKVNVSAEIDMDRINERLNKYKRFASKKEK